jgi:Neutral/alkaline non-lysosomal ceramidase, N-terminal
MFGTKLMRFYVKRFTFFIIFCLLIGLSSHAEAAEPTWRVGLARAVITPNEPVWMAGYLDRDRPAEEKIHDLWAKVAVFEDADGNRAVLLTADIVLFSQPFYDKIAAEVKTRYGIERSELILNPSHTHSGPAIYGSFNSAYEIDDQQMARIKEYSLKQLLPTLIKVIGQAIDDLKPAKLSVGKGEAHFAANRRNNPWGAVVDKLRAEGKLKGPTDPTVPVMTVSSPEGKLRSIIIGYACHNVTMCDNYQWCGDYAGFAQIDLEKKFPGVQAMFWQGCGADQNSAPRLGLVAAEKYGAQLAASVETALAAELRPLSPELRTAYTTIELPFGPLLTRDELLPHKDKTDVTGRWARYHLANLDAKKVWPTAYDAYPIVVWRLGEQLVVGLAGETVVDYALNLKKGFGQDTWVIGYCNDMMAYIPSDAVQKEGGYEAGCFKGFGIAAHDWAPGVEGRITDAVEKLVDKVRSK